jgi:hypothetical protein
MPAVAVGLRVEVAAVRCGAAIAVVVVGGGSGGGGDGGYWTVGAAVVVAKRASGVRVVWWRWAAAGCVRRWGADG